MVDRPSGHGPHPGRNRDPLVTVRCPPRTAVVGQDRHHFCPFTSGRWNGADRCAAIREPAGGVSSRRSAYCANSLTAWLKTPGRVVAAGTIMDRAGELPAASSADVSSRYRRDMRRHCRV